MVDRLSAELWPSADQLQQPFGTFWAAEAGLFIPKHRSGHMKETPPQTFLLGHFSFAW